MKALPLGVRFRLALQREVGRVLGIIWIIPIAWFMRFVMRYSIKDLKEVRRRYRELVTKNQSPILICPNHLTMADSAVIAWALGGSWWYLFRYSRLPWNIPEYNNFSFLWFVGIGAWITKCIPVVRGGDRKEISKVINKIDYLLRKGETALIFAEAGRSRTGRVRVDSHAQAVGRVMTAVPECQALCVYMRGDNQDSWSTVPKRGDSIYLDFHMFRPESEFSGMRRSRDIARQIVSHIADMESEYFANRK